VNLTKGWNVFSLPLKPVNTKVSSVLYSLAYGRDYDQVVKYDSTAKTYKHYVNDPDFDEFSRMEYPSSYLINITNPNGVKLHLTGDIPQSQQAVPLKQGWNLTGTPHLTEKGVEAALSGLQFNIDYDQVSRYNNASQLFDNYNRSSGDTLATLNPGDGTAVYCLKDKTWTTPVTSQAINVEFVYDGDGGRVKKITPNSTTTYVGSLYEVTNSVSTKHIFAGANRICSVESTGNQYFIHPDHLGSSNLVTDKDGNQVSLTEYTPYGTTNVHKGPDVTNYKFTDKELDAATGLYYNGDRYYDPELGRFTQADTVIQAPYDPQSLNRYSYCRNNPLNLTDPSGNKWSWKKFWQSFAGAALGAFLTVVLGPMGFGMSLTMAGMIGGMAGGALSGGLAGGWKGAFIGAALGGVFGAVGGWAVAGEHTFVLGAMFAGGVGYAAATDSWDSFAGGLAGGIAGGLVGGGIASTYSEQFANFRAGNGFLSNRDAAINQAFAEAEYSLNNNLADDPPVEVYWRKLERNDWVGDAIGRKHPFMRDTWNGEFHELQAVKSGDKTVIKILEGDISKMSKGTQDYWKTNPKYDEIFNASKSRFYQAISSYKAKYEGTNYSLLFRNCIGFKDYVRQRSEYGK
jgi:RHS repeat-associated protein